MAEIFPAVLRQRALSIACITENESPMLLAAGTAETDVAPRNNDRFADALRAHRGIVELKKYRGYGHDAIG